MKVLAESTVENLKKPQNEKLNIYITEGFIDKLVKQLLPVQKQKSEPRRKLYSPRSRRYTSRIRYKGKVGPFISNDQKKLLEKVKDVLQYIDFEAPKTDSSLDNDISMLVKTRMLIKSLVKGSKSEDMEKEPEQKKSPMVSVEEETDSPSLVGAKSSPWKLIRKQVQRATLINAFGGNVNLLGAVAQGKNVSNTPESAKRPDLDTKSKTADPLTFYKTSRRKVDVETNPNWSNNLKFNSRTNASSAGNPQSVDFGKPFEVPKDQRNRLDPESEIYLQVRGGGILNGYEANSQNSLYTTVHKKERRESGMERLFQL